MQLRAVALIFVVLLASLAGCDKKEETDQPVAVAAAQDPAPDSEWQQVQVIASDESRAMVERINALEDYAAARVDARGRLATEWAAILEARRYVRGAQLATESRLDDFYAAAMTRIAVEKGSAFQLAEAILYYGPIRDWAGESRRLEIDTVTFQGLAGEQLPIKFRLRSGVYSLRREAARVASLFGEFAEINPWALSDQRVVINFLVRRHAEGDLFDLEDPGRLNRRPMRRLLHAFEESMKNELLGVSLKNARPVFEDRAEQYVGVYEALTEIGRRKALKDFRAAREKYGDKPGAVIGFYYDWAFEHEVADRVDFDGQDASGRITGFWMRRMDDGTDRMLYTALDDLLSRSETDTD